MDELIAEGVSYTVIDCKALNEKFIKLVVDGIELLVIYKVSVGSMQMLDCNVGKGFPKGIVRRDTTLGNKLIGYLRQLAII